MPAQPRTSIAGELGATLHLAGPLIAGQPFAIGANVVDAMLAGHLGAHVLGAVAIGTSIWTFPLMTIIGVMMALPPSVAQLDGAGRRDEVVPLFRQAVWLALAVGVAMGLALWWLGPMLVVAMGVAPGLVSDVTAFLRAISFGTPALGLYMACRGFSEGLSMTRPTMLFGLVGLLVLGPVGYLLMYGGLGLPGRGALGSGIATALVCWVQALGFVAYVWRGRRYRGLRWHGGTVWPDFAAIGGLLRIALPMAVTLLMEAGLFGATGLLIGRLGEDAVASHQVALNVAVVAFMVPLGVAMATTIRVGKAVGRGDGAGVRRAGLTGICFTVLTQLVSGGAMLLFPGTLVSLYTSDPAVVAGAVALLRLAGIFQLSDGIQVASNGALRGLKDTRVPMFITGFAYWGIGMPVGWWLTFEQGMGARGMWIGLIAGLTTAAALLSWRFLRLSRAPRRIAGLATGACGS
jgi:MATE family multidrug resistance protein